MSPYYIMADQTINLTGNDNQDDDNAVGPVPIQQDDDTSGVQPQAQAPAAGQPPQQASQPATMGGQVDQQLPQSPVGGQGMTDDGSQSMPQGQGKAEEASESMQQGDTAGQAVSQPPVSTVPSDKEPSADVLEKQDTDKAGTQQESDIPGSTATGPARPVTPPPMSPGVSPSISQQPTAIGTDDDDQSQTGSDSDADDALPQTDDIIEDEADSDDVDETGVQADDTIDATFPPVSQSVKPPAGSPKPGSGATVEPAETTQASDVPSIQKVPNPQPAVQPTPVQQTPVQPGVMPQVQAAPNTLPKSAPQQPKQGQEEPTPTVPGAQATDELLKQHEPIFVMPERIEMGQVVTVKVKVGMIPHPMEEGHYIQSVELFAGEKSLGKKEFKPGVDMQPEADFQVPLTAGTQLKAVALCNVHGKWEGTHSINAQS